jgi:hypothetical protein
MPGTFPYFTTEKILKSAYMELFGVNGMLVTSPAHFLDLHEVGFEFANSRFIKEYTGEGVLNSLYECYNTDEIIETNNLKVWIIYFQKIYLKSIIFFNMTDEQFQTLMEMLNEIKELLQQSQQPQTKITVVGNKVQSNTKGLKNTEDFIL